MLHAKISFFFFNDTATTEIYTLSLHDALPILFDQWNDQIVDGISTPVRVGTGNVNMGEIGVHGWKNNLSTRTCFDVGTGAPGSSGYGDGVCQDTEQGLSLVPTNIRYRDGSISNLNSTDLQGFAGFNRSEE